MSPRLAFIGFGEAGQAIAEGLREEGVTDIVAWDILFPESAGAKLIEAATASGVKVASSAAEAVRDADIIIAAVTAASSHEAAQSVNGRLTGKPFYLDVNSVSPGRKQASAKLLGDTARYVDLAIVFGVAILINNVVAGLAGVLVPLTLEKFRVDPAVSSAVFVTLCTDCMGFLSFLGLAAIFVHG